MQLGILVGGASSRMGRPKGLLTIGGVTLLQRAEAHAKELGLEPVLVGDADPYVGHLPHVRRCPDAVAGVGPLGGLLALLRTGPCLLLACDMPFVEVDDLRVLLAAPPASAVLSRSAGYFEPLLARYDPSICHHIEAHLNRGERSFQTLLSGLAPSELHIVEFSARATRDWDEPSDIH